MSTDGREHTDIDFVVGAEDPVEDELLDTTPPRRMDRRAVVGLVVAALVVVAAVVTLRSNAEPHTTARPSHTAASPSHTVPVVPTFPSLTAGSQPTPTQVELTAGLCLPGHRCAQLHPSPKATAAVRAAIRRAFGGTDKLRIHDVALDAGPHRLFAREITAHTPHGSLIVLIAHVDPEVSVGFPAVGGSSVGTQTYAYGYSVGGAAGGRPGINLSDLGTRLDKLFEDSRLETGD